MIFSEILSAPETVKYRVVVGNTAAAEIRLLIVQPPLHLFVKGEHPVKDGSNFLAAAFGASIHFSIVPDILVLIIAGKNKKINLLLLIKTVSLGKMDYDNFCTDMVADRQFIEDYAELCSTGEIWKCIFVRQRGRNDGVLVIPTDGCYVKYAAYLPE